MSRPRPDLDISRHLIEPVWSPTHPIDESAPPIDWPSFFGNPRPVELEVGSGKGLFLANAASAHPDRNYLGVEITKKYARLAAERLVKQQIENARLWAGDIRGVMPRIIDRSLLAVHVYFPDPWWKKRHKKRRVFNADLVASIARTLQPGGGLHIASDVQEYYQVIRELMAADPRFEELPALEPDSPEHDLDYLTNFERKYRLEGRPIYRANYHRTNADAVAETEASTSSIA